jgi:hypothetical protein
MPFRAERRQFWSVGAIRFAETKQPVEKPKTPTKRNRGRKKSFVEAKEVL